jgi:hypothetical protein
MHSPEGAEKRTEFIQKRMAQWERSLLIISLPHTAAFGAWMGRYDFSKDSFLNSFGLFIFLMATTFWLFLLHNQLRNTYQRGWHPRNFERAKATLLYLFCFTYPLVPFVVAMQYKDIVDVETAGLMALTLWSWYLCAMWVSADINIKIMKALGIPTDD